MSLCILKSVAPLRALGPKERPNLPELIGKGGFPGFEAIAKVVRQAYPNGPLPSLVICSGVVLYFDWLDETDEFEVTVWLHIRELQKGNPVWQYEYWRLRHEWEKGEGGRQKVLEEMAMGERAEQLFGKSHRKAIEESVRKSFEEAGVRR